MEGTISRFIIYFLLYISDPKVERSFVSAHNCDRLENEKIHVCWYISLNWKRLDLRRKSGLKIVIFKDDIRFIRITSFSIKGMFIFQIIFNFCSE